jgi:ADP-heptose:LPS heptosyltransferase
MGVDSWSNHAGHFAFRVPESIQAKPVPSIILWGSTQSSAAGYPDNYNLSANPPCQPCFRENPKISAMPRGECPYLIDGLHPCMGDISVETVWAQVEKLLADDPQFGAESVAE